MIARVTKIEFPPGALTESRVLEFAGSGAEPWKQGASGQLYGFTLFDGSTGALLFVALWDTAESLDTTEERYRSYIQAHAADFGGRIASIERFAVMSRWRDPLLTTYARTVPGVTRETFSFADALAWLDRIASPEAGTAVSNKELIRRYVATVWNGRDLAAMGQFWTDEHVERMRAWWTRIHAAYSAFAVTIDDLVAEGDLVAARWTVRATHDGPVQTPWGAVPPTGRRQVSYQGHGIWRIANGLIAEGRGSQVDAPGLLRQLGVTVSLSTDGPKLAGA
ncbi:MAG: hypothetical protein NVS1B1_04950 [Candidatus Limnocylindrales bacterium]